MNHWYECPRVHGLWLLLYNCARTTKEENILIWLNYQSAENDRQSRRGGEIEHGYLASMALTIDRSQMRPCPYTCLCINNA